MKEITCPNCHTTFQVDDSAYASILSQVRTEEFERELKRRTKELQSRHEAMEETVRLRTEKNFDKTIAAKNEEINSLRNRLTQLQGQIDTFDLKLKAEISAVTNSKDRIIAEKEHETKLKVLEAKDASKEEIGRKEKRILELEARLEADRLTAANRESQLKELHQQNIQAKQEEIDRLKDFKLRLSTKMLGETLEQHCLAEFNKARSLGLYPDAWFDKDNIVADGTKGDFIFRDYIDGTEYVSIMFEMKNEADTTAAKHKNEHFFDKLDKDRTKKGCEFAVLVSMLEQGNELYDAGIFDAGYLYPKMLVIRPQFFLPVIRLISEGARKGFLQNRKLLAELEAARNESRDFTKFEERISKFTTEFGKHVKGAHEKFIAANEGIDKIIANLEKQIKLLRDVKASFEASDQRLLKADTYVDENLTVKKLTHGAPSVRKMIEEASAETQSSE